MSFASRKTELFFLPLIIWTLVKDRNKSLLFLGLGIFSIVLADGSGHVLKDLLGRQRPCQTIDNINLLVNCGDSFSMPSNHASNAFALAMTLLLLRRKMVSYFFVFFAAIVGFSRIYVGVHYPSDVVAGAILGTAVAYATINLYEWAKRIYSARSYTNALYLSLILISLFRMYYIFTGPLDLSPDEAHYWEWSRRLDWSYYSKGPLTAYIIFLGTTVFGDTVFGVRIIAVILSALGSIVFFRLGTRLYDERTGFSSALLLQIVPLYSAYGLIMTIDSPFIFFWILSLFFLHRVLDLEFSHETKKNVNYVWVILGVSVGLGLLAKYTMAFFYLCGFLFFLFHKDARRLLLTVRPYMSFIVSLIVFSPVLAWNAANGWVTFKHTAGQAHLADGLRISLKHFFEFFGSQLGVVTPVIFVMIFIAVWKLRKDKQGAFLFWFSVPVIVFFLLKSIQGKVQANWALTAYATGFIGFSAYYIRNLEMARAKIKIFVASGIALALFVTACAHYPSILNLPPDKDPTTRLVGWKELGNKMSDIYDEMKVSGPVFVFSEKYQVSSELAFYMRHKPVTYCINIGRRMNQYDLWPGFEKLTGYNAIFVRQGERDIPVKLRRAFGRYERQVLEIKTEQDKIMKFTVFKCYDFKGIKIKPVEKF
jgi:undecaprenyl-diphosphatase